MVTIIEKLNFFFFTITKYPRKGIKKDSALYQKFFLLNYVKYNNLFNKLDIYIFPISCLILRRYLTNPTA